jgi:hypothetical protein
MLYITPVFVEVAEKAAMDVSRLCRHHMGFAPEIQVRPVNLQ